MMSNGVPYPLVDLLNIERDVTENELCNIGDQIVKAFNQSGYVYLKNHNISLDDVESFVRATNTFFDLEANAKIKYQRNAAQELHGYSTEKDEYYRTSQSSSPKRMALKFKFNALGKSENYPDQEVPEIRITAKNLFDQAPRTAERILHCLELALKMKDRPLTNAHRQIGNNSNLKSTRYMPPEEDEHVIRFRTHCDFSTFTMQLYGDVEGLEFLDKDGVWQKPKMYPGHIIIFASELLQIWTGDQIKATMHRVIVPEDEDVRKQTRHSVILFIMPDEDSIIEPYDGSEKYKPRTANDIINEKLKLNYKDDV